MTEIPEHLMKRAENARTRNDVPSASSGEFTMPLFIRASHPSAYRSGQWAKVVAVRYLPQKYGDSPRVARPVYLVEFIDGKQDQWPVYDDVAEYEFSSQVQS